jgi:hypothetical protein
VSETPQNVGPGPAPADPGPAPAPSSDPGPAPADPGPAPADPGPAEAPQPSPAPSPTGAPGQDSPSGADTTPPADVPAERSAGVGDLVEYVVRDAWDGELIKRGVVVELLELPDENGDDVSLARVVELPDAGVIETDRLQVL